MSAFLFALRITSHGIPVASTRTIQFLGSSFTNVLGVEHDCLGSTKNKSFLLGVDERGESFPMMFDGGRV